MLIATFVAHADETDGSSDYVSAMRYVSVEAQGDNADSRQYSGTGSFTMSRYVWLQGTIGKIINANQANPNSLGDLQTYGAGLGFKNSYLQLQLLASHLQNDNAYRQRDVSAALDWTGKRFSIGMDIFHRNTDNRIDTIRNFPALGLSNVALTISETFTGNGAGLHAELNLTDNFSLSLGGMSYHYTSAYELSSSSNPALIRLLLAKRPTISELLYLNKSGVTRSLALLDSSYNAGARYQFSQAILSVQYFRDTALDSGGVTNTATLGVAITVSDHWVIAPQVGYSDSDQANGVGFGSMSISYNW